MYSKQNGFRWGNANRLDAHGINDSPPVEIRLIVVDGIAVLLAAEMLVGFSEASKGAITVIVEGILSFFVIFFCC